MEATRQMRTCECCERLTSMASLVCEWCYSSADTPPTWLNNRMYKIKVWGIAAATAVAVATAVGLGANLFPGLVGVRLVEDGAVRAAVYSAYFGLQLGELLSFVLAFVLVLVWMWRSAKNLEAFPRQSGDLSAGWAIGGWFIPIGNLFLPYRILSQIVREELLRRWAGIVGLWGACWVLSIVGSVAAAFLGFGQGTLQPAQFDPMSAHVEYFESRATYGYASALLVGVGGICLTILTLASSRAQAKRVAARAERLAKVAVPG